MWRWLVIVVQLKLQETVKRLHFITDFLVGTRVHEEFGLQNRVSHTVLLLADTLELVRATARQQPEGYGRAEVLKV